MESAMSAIQITLDYLEELRAIDPDATISVVIWSNEMKISKGEHEMYKDVHIIKGIAFTDLMFLHITSDGSDT